MTAAKQYEDLLLTLFKVVDSFFPILRFWLRSRQEGKGTPCSKPSNLDFGKIRTRFLAPQPQVAFVLNGDVHFY